MNELRSVYIFLDWRDRRESRFIPVQLEAEGLVL